MAKLGLALIIAEEVPKLPDPVTVLRALPVWVQWAVIVVGVFGYWLFAMIRGLADLTDAMQRIHAGYGWVRGKVQGRKLTDEVLGNRAKELADNLNQFATVREAADPGFYPNRRLSSLSDEEFQTYVQMIGAHHNKWDLEYRRDHLPSVMLLREEFLKRGLRNESVEEFYDSPTNYIGLRLIASALLELAAKLP